MKSTVLALLFLSAMVVSAHAGGGGGGSSSSSEESSEENGGGNGGGQSRGCGEWFLVESSGSGNCTEDAEDATFLSGPFWENLDAFEGLTDNSPAAVCCRDRDGEITRVDGEINSVFFPAQSG